MTSPSESALASSPRSLRDLASWPRDLDPVATAIVAVGFALLLLPLTWDWTQGGRIEGAQGHEVAIFAVSAFLLYLRRRTLLDLPPATAPVLGGLLFVTGLLLYVLGRAYDLRLALVSLMVLMAALLLLTRGMPALRASWFPVLFPLFALPLPSELVLAVTGPMKIAVSQVAAELLSALGYPIGRSGVVLTVGQYQLLVTEACAGLQTMFTLEAMGLLYASLVDRSSTLRNAVIAVLTVPIAFSANVVRVVVLALITYHFGDAAGQGFLHGFSGIVLFLVALMLVIAVDAAVVRVLRLKARG